MFKYLAVIPFLIVEGTLTTILAGSVATPAAGFYNVYWLFAIIVFADLCGDFIYYFIGKYAGSKILEKIFAWYKIPETKLEQSRNSFNKYGGRAIVIGKIVPNFGWPVIILSGSLNYNFFKFVIYITSVSFLKSAALIAVGYYLGKEAAGLYGYAWLLIIPVAGYLIYRLLKLRK